MSAYQFSYKAPGPVGASFIKSRPASLGDTLPIDIIIGPVGSGKSTCCAVRVFLHALEQPAGPDGWRRSRWAVVRNTNPMLEMTTIPTWLEWFPEEHFGKFRWSPPYQHTIRIPSLKVELDVWFVPLDRPDQVRNLLSLELTGVWINECREIAREIVVAARSRCGRYPSLRSGVAPGWAGVIMDTNMPEDEMHYLMLWSGKTPPPEWMDRATRDMMTAPELVTFFFQPGGLLAIRDERTGDVLRFEDNPGHENRKHLRPGYYRAQLSGNTVGWVLNMCCVEPTRSGVTRLIYPDFNERLHVAPLPLRWNGNKLLLGSDFARNPSVIVAQQEGTQIQILREFCGVNIDVAAFVKNDVIPVLNNDYPDWKHKGWGDPSGSNRTGGDATTAFSHAREGGLALIPAPSNDPDRRQRAVTRRLTGLTAGQPDILLSPVCTMLVAGFKGGYRFERKKVEGTLDTYHEEPAKNQYSHPHDGLQYLVLGLDGDRGTQKQDDEQRRTARHQSQPNGHSKVDPFALARLARQRKK